MYKNLLKFMIIGVLATIFMVACGSNDGGSSDNKANNDNNTNNTAGSDSAQDLVFATTAEAVGLSPIGTWDTPSGLVNNQLYESLFQVDFETNEIKPLLAESYEREDDVTWIFKLREDVTFHDGTPFNAEAVKFSYETQADPDTGSPAGHLLAFMDSIEVIDEYTLKFKTKEPNPNTLPVLANRAVSIVSPTAYENSDIMREPVGTGAYKFDSWISGDRIVLVRNEDYWGEKTALDSLTYLVVPDDSTAVSMLETGEVGFTNVSTPELITRMESMDGVEFYQEEGGSVFHLSFNMDKAPMNEIEFRKAVAMGVDSDSFIESLSGTGFKSEGFFGPKVLDYDESIEEHGYDFNPEKAKEIIEENNYGDYKLTLYARDDSGAKRQAEIAQADLSNIGLDVSIEIMELSTYMEETSEGKHDLYVGTSTHGETGLQSLYSVFHSDNLGGTNRTLVSHKEFDELVDEAKKTMDDADRQEIINAAHEIVIDDVFIVPMYHGINTIPHRDNVKGLMFSPSKAFFLNGAYIED